MFRPRGFAAISPPSKIAADRAALTEFNPDGAAADHADADGSPYCDAAFRTGADRSRPTPTDLADRPPSKRRLFVAT
jgi:hypothetical protein